jgi:hypothetical protein
VDAYFLIDGPHSGEEFQRLMTETNTTLEDLEWLSRKLDEEADRQYEQYDNRDF